MTNIETDPLLQSASCESHRIQEIASLELSPSISSPIISYERSHSRSFSFPSTFSPPLPTLFSPVPEEQPTKPIKYLEDVQNVFSENREDALPLPESDEPLYRRVAAALEELVRRGCLRIGDRMPSLRALSRRYCISVPTVTQAYVLLETQGVVEARTRSGFYLKGSRVPSQQKNEPQKEIGGFISSMMADAANSEFVSFGLCTPSPRLLPSVKLARALGAAARRMGLRSVEYGLLPGSLSLRQQIARRSVEWGCALSPEDLIITNGGIEAIALCIRALCNPGDTLAVESPTSPTVVFMLKELGVHTVEVDVSGSQGLDISKFAKLLTAKKVQGLFITSNFNNPCGSLMPDRNKRLLVELCALHNVPIIEDDVHGDLSFDIKRPMCLKALDRKDGVLLCGSFSRTLAPSYRVGYVVPGRFFRDVIDRKAVTNMSNSTLPTLAIAEFLANGGYDYHLRALRRALADQTSIMAEAILTYFPEGTRIIPPQGGPVLWVQLPAGLDGAEVFQQARQRKVSIVPGSACSSSRMFKDFIRISCGYPWSDTVEGALKRVAQIVESMLAASKMAG